MDSVGASSFGMLFDTGEEGRDEDGEGPKSSSEVVGEGVREVGVRGGELEMVGLKNSPERMSSSSWSGIIIPFLSDVVWLFLITLVM